MVVWGCDTLKQHDESIQKAAKAVDASILSCKKASEGVATFISDAKLLLESLKEAPESNTNKFNIAIESLSTSLQAEEDKFDSVRTSLQADQATLLSSITSPLDKLQVDLAMENKIMDELARKTTLLEVQSIKLTQANKDIYSLNSERVVIKSCVPDVFAILSNLVNAHDLVLTLSVRNHLTEKLLLALKILSRIEGVTESIVTPQQGGEDLQNPPKQSSTIMNVTTKPKGNEASGSSVKDKGKGIMGQDYEEEETEEEREKIEKDAHDTLVCRQALFPLWSLEKLMKEAIESPSTHWLEPVVFFYCENTRDSQFDMPITRRAFVFHCFGSIVNVPSPDLKVDQELINYYLQFSQPQYLTWSAQKITLVKVLKPTLGASYIMEVAKMGQEIASVLRKKPTVKPIGKTSDANRIHMGKIDSKHNIVMFTRGKDQRFVFALDDKHLFSTTCLENIIDIIHRCKLNSESDKKNFTDMLRWYISFLQTLLSIIPMLFKTVVEMLSLGSFKTSAILMLMMAWLKRTWWTEVPSRNKSLMLKKLEDGSIRHTVQKLAKYRFLKVNYERLLPNCFSMYRKTISKCYCFFSPSNFMKFGKDELGRILILPFYLCVMRMVSYTQARIDMSELDEDYDGFIQPYAYIRGLIPNLARLCDMPTKFVQMYCHIVAYKFFFFCDPIFNMVYKTIMKELPDGYA
uniref:Uncharacterized protein n=1 Tax=Lactuca sativa TaxID=4236 RepID=A0A9R1XXP8_LACSA|nr:hypothetical protein LSAT_V11C100043130 [Lactuca sativa]